MTDHESFVLLAAKSLSEPLPAKESDDLEAHLAACPACRRTAAGMRADDAALRGVLEPMTVSPHVRRRVLDETLGRRHLDARILLGIAAALVVLVIGLPILAGGRFVADQSPADPSPSASTPSVSTPSPAATDAPTAPASPTSATATPAPSASSAVASPEPTLSAPSVLGNYVYGTTPPRRDTLAARLDDGRPVGEWSRRTPATGDSSTYYGGPVTCLEISGSEAWLAGPATTATDGGDHAVFIHVTDGGPDGQGDTAFLWLTTPGQTIVTMTDWCESRFTPTDGLPLSTGDVRIDDASP
jgi:hypothetical protein